MRNFQRQLHRSDVSEELDDCKAACEGRAPRPSQIKINTLHFARPVSTSSRSDDDEDVKDDETRGVMMILRTGACLIRTADAFVTAHGLITVQLELYRESVLMCRNLEGHGVAAVADSFFKFFQLF